jgi:hypothetical protein
VDPNRQVGEEKAGARTESLDALHAALRALTRLPPPCSRTAPKEHGAHVADRSHAVAPTLDLLRHARERIAAGLKNARQPGSGRRRLTMARAEVIGQVGVTMMYVITLPCVDLKDKTCIEGVPGRLHLRG